MPSMCFFSRGKMCSNFKGNGRKLKCPGICNHSLAYSRIASAQDCYRMQLIHFTILFHNDVPKYLNQIYSLLLLVAEYSQVNSFLLKQIPSNVHC